MTCEELRSDYGPWALGIAEDPARSEISGHVAQMPGLPGRSPQRHSNT